jgi:hypothetical protein
MAIGAARNIVGVEQLIDARDDKFFIERKLRVGVYLGATGILRRCGASAEERVPHGSGDAKCIAGCSAILAGIDLVAVHASIGAELGTGIDAELLDNDRAARERYDVER